MKSEFQKILEEKMTGRKSGTDSEGGDFDRDSKLKFGNGSGENGSASFATEDFLTAPKRFFRASFYFVKSGPQATVQTTSRPESKKDVPSEPAREPQSARRREPVPRMKRERTFDQSRALKIFVKFGETSVDDFATDDEIRSAYRRLAKRFHPDRGGRQTEDAFKLISSAYRKLIL